MLLNPERSAHLGRNFKKRESGNVINAAASAAAAVVRFQKNPSIKIAKIPGETKPVYSWMY